MANFKATRWLLGAALGAFLFTGAAAAQDPMVANPETTHLKLENERVRVYESTLAPGEKENPHTHGTCVIYVIAGGKLRLHNSDGTTAEATLETGATFYREPLTHWTENIGDTHIKVVLVELKEKG